MGVAKVKTEMKGDTSRWTATFGVSTGSKKIRRRVDKKSTKEQS